MTAGPVLDVSLPSHAVPQPLPVQDVLPGRDLLTAAPVEPHPAAPQTRNTPTPTSAPTPAGEAYDRPAAELATAVALPPAVPAEPVTVPGPSAPEGTWSGQPAPVDDLSTSLALLLATGPEAPPSAVPPAAPAIVDAYTSAGAWVPAPGGETLAAPAATGAVAVPAATSAEQEAADLVPAQVRRHVELGFRDGSSAALDPDSEQALALAELSSLLTARD